MLLTHLRAVYPCCWAETKTIAHCVDEYEYDTDDICCFAFIPGIYHG